MPGNGFDFEIDMYAILNWNIFRCKWTCLHKCVIIGCLFFFFYHLTENLYFIEYELQYSFLHQYFLWLQTLCLYQPCVAFPSFSGGVEAYCLPSFLLYINLFVTWRELGGCWYEILKFHIFCCVKCACVN